MPCSRRARDIISGESRIIAGPGRALESIVRNKLKDILERKGIEELMRAMEEVIECYYEKAEEERKNNRPGMAAYYVSRARKWQKALIDIRVMAGRVGVVQVDGIIDNIMATIKVSSRGS